MTRPNVIYILADDLGYGDVATLNPDSRIPTPNLDRMARRGMTFTDAHAASSVCTPSRYSILTGRYAWRSRLSHGIVWPWDGALIEPDRTTVGHLFQRAGYRTSCIGKWHLGLDWATHDGRHPNDTLPFGKLGQEISEQRVAFGDEQVDLRQPFRGGPVDRGFDSYFGVDVPNFPPYCWFEDDRVTPLPLTDYLSGRRGFRDGQMAQGWSLEAMIPEFTRRVVRQIEAGAESDEPYFLYFPLTSPHGPIVPNEAFKGMSDAGLYGDFVCEVDWIVGQVLDALERTGTLDDTLVLFTSDNGPECIELEDIGAYDRVQKHGHHSMGQLRGVKRDVWEGGHRVPLLAHWPAQVSAGVTCDQTVCLSDFMATCAELLGTTLDEQTGEDSVSMLPLLRGNTDQPTRRDTVHHSARGTFALRQDGWVYIDAPSGGDNDEPDWWQAQRGYTAHDQPGELFDLQDDPAERVNRFAEQPERVTRMRQRLSEVRGAAGGAGTVSDEPEHRLSE